MKSKKLHNKLLDYLLNKSGVLIFELSPSFDIINLNPAALKTFGHGLIGKKFTDSIISFVETFDIKNAFKNSISVNLSIGTLSGLPDTFMFDFEKDGDEYFIVAERNHEELDLLKNSLLESNKELSTSLRELSKLNSKLKKLNEIKNEFLGTAAHDLRNPIGYINNYIDLILNESMSEEDIRQILVEIKDISKFAFILINDLLDYSAIESGNVRLDLQKTDTRQFLKSVIKGNIYIAKAKKIKLQLSLSEECPSITIDNNKIKQVLNNLIGNAIKYSENGKIVEVFQSSENGFITLGVKDFGIGISKDDMFKIFKPFEKIGNGGTLGEKSTGLGLAIVKRIIEAHKGKIEVFSELGRGTTFYIHLPKEIKWTKNN